MKLTYTIKINNKVMKNITKYSALLNELTGDEQRNACGGLIRYRIARIPSISLETGILEPEEMKELLQLLALPKVTIEWYDPESGTYRSGEFYAGEHEPEIYSMNPLRYGPLKIDFQALGGI